MFLCHHWWVNVFHSVSFLYTCCCYCVALFLLFFIPRFSTWIFISPNSAFRSLRWYVIVWRQLWIDQLHLFVHFHIEWISKQCQIITVLIVTIIFKYYDGQLNRSPVNIQFHIWLTIAINHLLAASRYWSYFNLLFVCLFVFSCLATHAHTIYSINLNWWAQFAYYFLLSHLLCWAFDSLSTNPTIRYCCLFIHYSLCSPKRGHFNYGADALCCFIVFWGNNTFFFRPKFRFHKELTSNWLL